MTSVFVQPLRLLLQNLRTLASPEQSLFTPDGLRALLPGLSDAAFKTLLSRAASEEHLVRVCRGIYLYEPAAAQSGLLLFHAAARLRAGGLNYISLETALSDAGVISQVPIQRVTIMSSGRSSLISCGRWGKIEFVHTRQSAQELSGRLTYDPRCRLWRADVAQALRDMRATHRSTDLVDWNTANELV